jgi:hypothetical protein
MRLTCSRHEVVGGEQKVNGRWQQALYDRLVEKRASRQSLVGTASIDTERTKATNAYKTVEDVSEQLKSFQHHRAPTRLVMTALLIRLCSD